ncbi:RNA polymerase-associated protein LEO1-like [Chenopodium quinoa]|uniref:Calmodulin-binding domain-containing protein n=1 Tax=Chenopodium quinoa TaxID=63459 RepID=A0A803MYE5_CHEQI|nr:RNA polymerase-associated protein LEO1-like [Chenopodium quinoa]
MVQRKVGNNNIIKTEKIQVYTKPSLQNHHNGNMSKGADMNGIKMKKSRSIEVGFRSSSKGSHDVLRRPGKPPSLGSSTPKTQSSSKSSDTSPNYMKSTRSYEARKEERLQKVAKTLSRTSSSYKIVRTLSKVPSFKHCARTTTCSSTLKDSKFPRYLKLKPGATEAEGRSVPRVCSYNHCSLNGDHHNPAPPLKRFMSTRRRLLKTQKVDTPKVLSPHKAKLSECKGKGKQEQKEDFFVEIYVSDRGVDTPVSQSLSDGPCSEIDQSEEPNYSNLNFCPKDEDYPLITVQSYQEVESSPSVSLDEFSCGNSDIEWEQQEQTCVNDNCEIHAQSDCSYDENKSDFETGSSHGGYLETCHEYPPYVDDEIVEYLCFSDADSLPDCKSAQTGERNIEEPLMVEEKDEMNSGAKNEVAEEDSTLADEATELNTEVDEPTNTKGEIITDLIKEITEAQDKGLDSYQEPVKTEGDQCEKSDEDYNIGEAREENAADPGMEEREPIEEITEMPQTTEKLETSDAKEGICTANNDDQDGTDHSGDFATRAGQKANEAAVEICFSTRSEKCEDENDSSELESNENYVEGDKASGMENSNSTEATSRCTSNNGESDGNQELNSCNKLKRGMRCMKADEDDEESQFNPRGPNFLDVEPDPEAEKVDLRHQEIDGRRNAEEWMLDHALQKTVNQLTPSQKRKVALLVEAYETVLPVAKDESMRKNSSESDHEKLDIPPASL